MHDVVYSYKRLSQKHRALCTVYIRNSVLSDFHPIIHDQTVHSGNKSILRCPLWTALVSDFRLTSCWSRSISLVLLSNQKHSLFSAPESCLVLFRSPRSPNNTTPCETSTSGAHFYLSAHSILHGQIVQSGDKSLCNFICCSVMLTLILRGTFHSLSSTFPMLLLSERHSFFLGNTPGGSFLELSSHLSALRMPIPLPWRNWFNA